MKSIISALIIVTAIMLFNCTEGENERKLSGPYLGLELPGRTPEVFAPGVVSTGLYERDLTILPDGKEIYFTAYYKRGSQNRIAIICLKQTNGVWSEPEVVSFSGMYYDGEPHIQPDGKRMFFTSNRPIENGKENKYRTNLWYMNRTESGWDEPKPAGDPINGHGNVFYPTATKKGDLYFTRQNEDRSEYIYRSRLIDGKYGEPEKLPENVNNERSQYHGCISPDEDYLVIPLPKDGIRLSYYVSFRDDNDNWSELIDLRDIIDPKDGGYAPSFSYDGKFFFFNRHEPEVDSTKTMTYSDIVRLHNETKYGNSDIFWVNAEVIKELNPFKK